MKGSIRIIAGMILTMGGVGGIETSMEPGIPMDSLALAIGGLIVFASGAFAAAAAEAA
jgi:hypothetical protein